MNASDFADNSLTGITTVINGSCSITKTLTNDFTIEGTESFQIVIRTGSSSGPIIATSSAIIVGDTSVPIYSVTPSTTSVNEGSTVTFNIATSGVDNGTIVYYDITGSAGISASDFTSNSLSGSLVISGTFNSGTATTSLTLVNDVATEGTETFNMNLRTGSISGSIVRVSPTIIINDTSLTPELYSFTSFTFTNATAEGTTGPTLANLQSSYSAQSWASNTAYLNLFNSTRGYQYWTVPKNGTYRLTAAGAQGGAVPNSSYGGFGVKMQATISLLKDEYLIFVIGQRGGYTGSGGSSAGGGGGTFIFKTNLSTPILIAGGGGGSSTTNTISNAVTTNNGANSSNGNAGGTSGNGGGSSSNSGGGGAGLIGNGLSTQGSTIVGSGNNINTGVGTGGRGGTCATSQSGTNNFNSLGRDQGGFGGGGGGEWCTQGATGGGGGYSGGAAGNNAASGGGGSYVNLTLSTLVGTSNGTYNSTGTYTNIGYNGSSSTADFSNSMGYVLVEKI